MYLSLGSVFGLICLALPRIRCGNKLAIYFRGWIRYGNELVIYFPALFRGQVGKAGSGLEPPYQLTKRPLIILITSPNCLTFATSVKFPPSSPACQLVPL
jgi:hypothetical protein